MPIKIDEGVPIPKGRMSRGGYPFASMKVGDSFLVPDRNVSQAASYYKKKHPDTDFRTKKSRDGWRVWRIK